MSTTASSRAGIARAGAASDGRTRCCERIACNTSGIDARSNGRLPTSSSYRTTPSDHTSDCASPGVPSVCSGDMYTGVPTSAPAIVRLSAGDDADSGGKGCAASSPRSLPSASGLVGGVDGPPDRDVESSVSATAASSATPGTPPGGCSGAALASGCARSFARPKSSTLMRPSRVRMRLSLLMSRCRISRSWAVANASAASAHRRSASAGARPLRASSDSGSPSTSSMTMKICPCHEPTSCTVTMPG